MQGRTMTREALEKFLGKEVEVVFFDNSILKGVFLKNGGQRFMTKIPYYCIKDGYMLMTTFSKSHIKKIKIREEQ